MADSGPSAATRDDEVPIIAVTESSETDTPHSSSRTTIRSKMGKLKPSNAATKIREKLSAKLEKKEEKLDGSGSSGGMHDRLMAMLLQQIIPSDHTNDDDTETDMRSRAYINRPAFSLATMSTNFRRFNARIGVAFEFESRMIALFTWMAPTNTLAFLAIYTFICLDPKLLAVVPLALCCNFVMVPAFLARHPPPPSTSATDFYPLDGPPLAPPPRFKPASELSQDFFRNMRDLQNIMDDYSCMYDHVVKQVLPFLNFSDETFSSSLFIALFLSSLVLFVAAQLIPWRFAFLIVGWVAIGAGHPKVRDYLTAPENRAMMESQEKEAESIFNAFSDADIILNPAPEIREVEIFELQHRPSHSPNAEWESFVFTPVPYTPLSPARLAGERPRGTRFFEDVQTPEGWRWADKKWTLDMMSREWVEERCITGVEVEMEGERWVSDILYEDEGEQSGASNGNGKGKGKEKAIAWEEGQGRHRLDEWRRRRWTRFVERVVVTEEK
ncbi:Pex24p-domain-containing protein [Trichodelitschia bisporula]|uniref:Pex24p-domain-containing protein n=1 Tax=Trichodelitschia bisporula TaxID=703511 RepID=A0A6G1HNW5_9PEZI|nr:Pex24p-domain-containing protein [Trichodelitschia bisporula]